MDPPKTVSSIQFLEWQDLYEREKPFQVFAELDPKADDQRKTNLVFEPYEVSIKNLRGIESDFSLDSNGFVVRKLPPFKNSLDASTVKSVYLPQIEKLIRDEIEGVHRVTIFDWRIRQTNVTAIDDMIDLGDHSAPLKPANYAHIDTTPATAIERVLKELGDEAKPALMHRFQLLNIWRPLDNCVEDWPLTICDGGSVNEKSLVESDQVWNNNRGSITFAMHDNAQKWYYLHHQKEEEVLIFKQFDIHPDVPVKRSLHASFKHRHIRPDAPSRKSIEVRALVFS